MGACTPHSTHAAAVELDRIGMGAEWIAHELDVSRRTVGRWLRGERPTRRLEPPRPLAPKPYAYLLGLYLGDGHIAKGAHAQSVP